MKTKTLFVVALFLALLVCAPDARASSIFNLDINNGCCGNGPYGTVQLFQNGPNEVDLQVNLNPGFDFVHTGQDGVFGFDLAVIGTPIITVSADSIHAGFSGTAIGSPASHGEHMDGLGRFDFVITDDGNHTNGASQPIGQTLSFSVTDTSGILISNFLHDSTGGGKASYFVADVWCTACTSQQTGFVGTDDVVHTESGNSTNAVPEPATLFGSGLGLLAFGMLRFKRKSK
jgi:PEP-CTERM motif